MASAAVVLNLRYARSAPYREHLNKGIALAHEGKPREAEREWRAALRSDPSRIEPYQLLSRLYLDVGEVKEAIPLLERLQQISPKSPHLQCSLADAYVRADKFEKSLETARQAVILEPECAQAHAILGIFLGDRQDTKGALSELSRAVALAPKDDKIVISYAQAQLDASDLTGAERSARDVIARNPAYATAWYTLGRAYARRDPTPENLSEAIAAFTKAVELNSAFGDAWGEIGRLKVLAGDYKGAISSLEHIWKKGVRTKEAAFNLATAYRRTGDITKARALSAEFKRISDFSDRYEALQKRLSVEPNNLDAATQLAEMEIQSGNLDNARILVQGVLQRRPRDRRALKAAADMYSKLGDADLARAYKQRLVSGKDDMEARRQ